MVCLLVQNSDTLSMNNLNSTKQLEKKSILYFHKNNLIAFVIVAIFLFYILFALYKKVYYPIRQFFKNKNPAGYIIHNNGYEHRLLVEKWLGRKLTTEEEVHHINGKKWDNSRYNLAVMTRENHKKWHARLDWMFANKMFPKISTQRKKLAEEFGAILF